MKPQNANYGKRMLSTLWNHDMLDLNCVDTRFILNSFYGQSKWIAVKLLVALNENRKDRFEKRIPMDRGLFDKIMKQFVDAGFIDKLSGETRLTYRLKFDKSIFDSYRYNSDFLGIIRRLSSIKDNLAYIIGRGDSSELPLALAKMCEQMIKGNS
jgi:hypothetical protein